MWMEKKKILEKYFYRQNAKHLIKDSHCNCHYVIFGLECNHDPHATIMGSGEEYENYDTTLNTEEGRISERSKGNNFQNNPCPQK